MYHLLILSKRRLRGFSTLLVCLALLGAGPAGASTVAGVAECESRLFGAPDGESAAVCLSELAFAPGPARAPALRRLEELAETDPWFGIQLAILKKSTPQEAERLYRRSIEQARTRRLARAEVYARAAFSRLLTRAQRQEEAGRELEEASRVAKASGDPKALAKASIARANFSMSQGDLEQAYVDLAEVQAGEDPSLQREYLNALANVTQQTGRFPEARRAFGQLAELGEKTGDPLVAAMGLSGLATTRKEELSELPSEKGRQEALDLAQQALESARATGHPESEVNALWVIGSLSADPAEARHHLERCLEVAATSRLKSYCQAVLARRLAKSDPVAAEGAIQAALSLAQGDRLSWPSAWHERMRLRWAVAPPGQAYEDSLSALDAIEALRDQQEGSARQPGLFSTWADDYYWLSGKLLESDRLEDAFGVTERMRARTLTDALGMPRPRVPPALHVQRAEVALAITRIQQRLLEDLPAADREVARAGLERLENEADRIRIEIQRSDPSLAGPHRPGFASLEQVRRGLGPDEALLSFQVAPWKDLAGDFGGGSWLLVSTAKRTQIHQLDDRSVLRTSVKMFSGLFGSDADAAAALYNMLLKEGLAGLPAEIRKLVIVPDDALHRLPFAALRQDADDGEPLAARYQISLVPSATLWLRWRDEKEPPSGEPALVFADPPPRKKGQSAERAAAAFAERSDLGELPLSREEGESVLHHLGGRSRLLLRGKASEARLKSGEAEGFRIVHFATHSWTDVDPERSYVYLARGNEEQDGLLQPPEIAELNLHGRIVVLSSCESAAGEILRGEGVMGLARAFFQSGAHPVVASLWNLRDDYGKELFDRFYAHLAEGRSVAQALQDAQQDRIRDGAPTEAWAGVVVLGDGDRVPFPGGRKRSFLPAVAVIGILLLIALFLSRRPAPPVAR